MPPHADETFPAVALHMVGPGHHLVDILDAKRRMIPKDTFAPKLGQIGIGDEYAVMVLAAIGKKKDRQPL